MISLFTFILVLSLLIIVHEFGHFIAAKRIGVKVEQFSLGFGMKLLKININGTEYSIGLIPLGGFVKLAGDNPEEFKGQAYEFLAKSVSKRFQVIFFGPLLNYVLGFLFFWGIFFTGFPTLTTKVGGIVDELGAKKAGIAAGDKVIAVDGKKVAFFEELQEAVQDKRTAGKARLVILREGKEFKVDVAIKETEVEDVFGRKHKVGLLGIMPSDEAVNVRHGFVKSAFLGGQRVWDLTVLTYEGLLRMISGKMSMRESVTGPLGIFFITSKAASLGILAVMHLIAVLSVSLAIFNLLPFPVLDGGHIFLLGIEKIRGKPLGLKLERIISQIGVTILISLVILITYNDILRLFGDRISSLFRR